MSDFLARIVRNVAWPGTSVAGSALEVPTPVLSEAEGLDAAGEFSLVLLVTNVPVIITAGAELLTTTVTH